MKRILSILLSALMLFTLVGCGSSKTEEKKEEVTINKLDLFKENLKEAGYEVGDNQEVAYSMLYANNGYKFTVDGELIEIYWYDKDNLLEGAEELLESARNTAGVNMSGFNIPVKYHDYMLLCRADEHSKGQQIINIFINL